MKVSALEFDRLRESGSMVTSRQSFPIDGSLITMDYVGRLFEAGVRLDWDSIGLVLSVGARRAPELFSFEVGFREAMCEMAGVWGPGCDEPGHILMEELRFLLQEQAR